MGISKQQLIMVAVLLCGSLLVILNQTFLSPALPSIMADLSVEATTVQWLTSGFSMVQAVVIPLSAFFIGRFSTRQLFMGGLSLFCLGSITAAISPSFPVLLLGRVFQAAAAGVIMPMVMTVILVTFPREKRGSAMGIVGLVIGFAPAIGPSTSGVIVDSMGWRVLFLVVSCIALIVIVLAAAFLKNREGFAAAPFDKLSVVLLSFGMVCLLYGLSSITSSDNLAVVAALIAVGLVLLALFVRRQLKLDTPLLRVQILKSRRYRTAACLVALLQAGLIGTGVVLPIYIQGVLGASATVSGMVMLPGAVLGAIAGVVAGRVFDRHGVRGIACVGGLLLFAAGLGTTFFSISTTVVMVSAVYAVLGTSLQLLTTPLNTWGMNSLDNSVIQHANAVGNTLNQVGGALGTAVIVSLTAIPAIFHHEGDPLTLAAEGYHFAFMGLATVTCLVLLGIIFAVRDKQGDLAPRAAAPAKPASSKTADEEWFVFDVMNAKPHYVRADASIGEAIAVFAKTETTGVPVVDDQRNVVGFISDGDIMAYLAKSDVALGDGTSGIVRLIDDETAQEKLSKLLKLSVMTLATKRVISVEHDTPMMEACKVLSERRIKKIPVLKEGKLVGSLSRRNVIHAIYEGTTMPYVGNAAGAEA